MDIDVQLACRLLFVDMEGLNDGRAVKTIVPQINPRKMVGVQKTVPRVVILNKVTDSGFRFRVSDNCPRRKL
jgi:hypothetical protein